MKRSKSTIAFTLIELMIDLAILAVLVTLVVSVGSRVRTQGEIRLAESTLGVLVVAIEQYHEFWDEFPIVMCNDGKECTETELAEELDGPTASIIGGDLYYDDPEDEKRDEELASGSALYFYLSRTPTSGYVEPDLDNPTGNRARPKQLVSGEKRWRANTAPSSYRPVGKVIALYL